MSGEKPPGSEQHQIGLLMGVGRGSGHASPPQIYRRESGLASPQRTQASSGQVYRTVVHRLCKHHCSNHIIRHIAQGFWGLDFCWRISSFLFFFIYYYFWLDSLIFSSLFDFYPHFNYLITLRTVYVMADFALTVSTFCWLRALLLPILMSFVTPGSRLPQKTIQSIHPLPTSHTWC